MHQFKSLIFILLLFPFFTSCEEEKTETPAPEPTTGQYTFYVESDLGVGHISVKVEGESAGTITHFHSTGPTCGSGDVNVTKSAGTYNWTATGASGGTWSGTITIVNGECKLMKLTNSGGVGGDGTTPGQITFYTETDLGAGDISVYVEDEFEGTISQIHSSGVTCGSGNVNVTRSPGTYNWTATGENGGSWSGTATFASGGCATLKITGAVGGGGTTNCPSMNSHLSIEYAQYKTGICGNPNDFSLKVRNNHSQTITVRYAIKKVSGVWDCGINSVQPGQTGSYYSCKATGEYKIYSMLASDWIDNCNFNSAFGTCGQ